MTVHRNLKAAGLALKQVYEIRKLLQIHNSIDAASVRVLELTEIILEGIARIGGTITEADFPSDKTPFSDMLSNICTRLGGLVVSSHRESRKRKRKAANYKVHCHPPQTCSVQMIL